jgi:hypothetical protein
VAPPTCAGIARHPRQRGQALAPRLRARGVSHLHSSFDPSNRPR